MASNRGNENEPLFLGVAVAVELFTILAARYLLNLDLVTSGAAGLVAGGGSRIAIPVLRSTLRGAGRFIEVAADALGHPV